MSDHPDTGLRGSSRREPVIVPQHEGTVPLWAMALAAGATLAIGSAALYSALHGASRYRQHTYRRANEELRENARRALQMKRAAGPQARIPEHQTSHQGGVRGGQIGYNDTDVGPQSTYTPNLKRSRVARSGDAN
jgi:hypothetical protein